METKRYYFNRKAWIRTPCGTFPGTSFWPCPTPSLVGEGFPTGQYSSRSTYSSRGCSFLAWCSSSGFLKTPQLQGSWYTTQLLQNTAKNPFLPNLNLCERISETKAISEVQSSESIPDSSSHCWLLTAIAGTCPFSPIGVFVFQLL